MVVTLLSTADSNLTENKKTSTTDKSVSISKQIVQNHEKLVLMGEKTFNGLTF